MRKIIYFLCLIFLMLHRAVLATEKDKVLVTNPVTINNSFTKAVFALGGTGVAPVLFLAALDAKDPKQSDLARLALVDDGAGGQMAKITTLVPLATTDKPSLSGQSLHLLAVFNNQKPVVISGNPAIEVSLLDPATGFIEAPSNGINDFASTPIEKSIVGLTASKDRIFVAVPQADKPFNDDSGKNRGIAVLTIGEGLVQQGTTAKLDVDVNKALLAFVDAADAGNAIAQAKLGAKAAMTWDDSLQRLYIGLNNVQRDNANKTGGILGVAMGYFDKDQLKLAPIVFNPQKILFYEDATGKNVNDRMVGFYYDGINKPPAGVIKNNGIDEVLTSIDFIRTMHTSTDKHYLLTTSIIPSSGPVAAGGLIFFGVGSQEGIYALPLIADELGGDPMAKGTIAKVVDQKAGIPSYVPPIGSTTPTYDKPVKFVDMPTTASTAVQVGHKPPFSVASISDLFVAGDSVYVALKGATPAQRGIYQTTALFNKEGFIADWTTPVRVMGSDVKVFGAGLDTKKGNFYFLSNQDDATAPVVNTGQITQWGDSQAALHGGDSAFTLTSVLASIFPQEMGGVHQIFSFNAQTPGFGPGSLTVLVAVGLDTVAVIQSGADSAGDFKPTVQYSKTGPNKNVFVFSNPVLQAIGPISCAEIVSAGAGQPVYLFVGGYGGVARLQLGTWQIHTLDPAVLGAQAFTSFSIDSPVVKIKRGEDSNRIHILTQDTLVTRDIATGNHGGTTPIPVPFGTDLVVVDQGATVGGVKNALKALIATVSGLQTTSDFKVATPVAGVPGVALQMQYLTPGLDKNGVPVTPGTLYALTLDQDGKAQIFRLAVSNDAKDPLAIPLDVDAKKQSTPYLSLDALRSNFTTDGTMLFNLFPKDVTNLDLILTTSISSNPVLADQQSLTTDLGINLAENFNVGVMVRDDASGAWLVPGDWGVKVNE